MAARVQEVLVGLASEQLEVTYVMNADRAEKRKLTGRD
jgi:hypothetical protein